MELSYYDAAVKDEHTPIADPRGVGLMCLIINPIRFFFRNQFDNTHTQIHRHTPHIKQVHAYVSCADYYKQSVVMFIL